MSGFTISMGGGTYIPISFYWVLINNYLYKRKHTIIILREANLWE